jgi:hypothetical protein
MLEPIAAGIGAIDRKRYGRLLARFTPKVIETEAEHNAALAIVESLMEKGEDNLSRERIRCLIFFPISLAASRKKSMNPWRKRR